MLCTAHGIPHAAPTSPPPNGHPHPCAQADLEATDAKGRTPLLRALANRDEPTALLLLAAGANGCAADRDGLTALAWATHTQLRQVEFQHQFLFRNPLL